MDDFLFLLLFWFCFWFININDQTYFINHTVLIFENILHFRCEETSLPIKKNNFMLISLDRKSVLSVRRYNCVIWFLWHCGQSGVCMAITDSLVPVWPQVICNHHGDIGWSVFRLCTAQLGGPVLKAFGRVQYTPFQLTEKSPMITDQHTAGESVSH